MIGATKMIMASGPGLEEWPERRREALLWRYALEHDYDGVADLVQEAGTVECRWRWTREHHGHTTAILGDDGRYHLIRAGELLCTELRPLC